MLGGPEFRASPPPATRGESSLRAALLRLVLRRVGRLQRAARRGRGRRSRHHFAELVADPVPAQHALGALVPIRLREVVDHGVDDARALERLEQPRREFEEGRINFPQVVGAVPRHAGVHVAPARAHGAQQLVDVVARRAPLINVSIHISIFLP